MIRPLRRWYLRVWLVLPAALLGLLAAAVAARRPTTPVNPRLHWEGYR